MAEDDSRTIGRDRLLEPGEFAWRYVSGDIMVRTHIGAAPFVIEIRIHDDEAPVAFIEISMIVLEAEHHPHIFLGKRAEIVIAEHIFRPRIDTSEYRIDIAELLERLLTFLTRAFHHVAEFYGEYRIILRIVVVHDFLEFCFRLARQLVPDIYPRAVFEIADRAEMEGSLRVANQRLAIFDVPSRRHDACGDDDAESDAPDRDFRAMPFPELKEICRRFLERRGHFSPVFFPQSRYFLHSGQVSEEYISLYRIKCDLQRFFRMPEFRREKSIPIDNKLFC